MGHGECEVIAHTTYLERTKGLERQTPTGNRSIICPKAKKAVWQAIIHWALQFDKITMEVSPLSQSKVSETSSGQRCPIGFTQSASD